MKQSFFTFRENTETHNKHLFLFYIRTQKRQKQDLKLPRNKKAIGPDNYSQLIYITYVSNL